jgi:hypothetical protein
MLPLLCFAVVVCRLFYHGALLLFRFTEQTKRCVLLAGVVPA